MYEQTLYKIIEGKTPEETKEKAFKGFAEGRSK